MPILYCIKNNRLLTMYHNTRLPASVDSSGRVTFTPSVTSHEGGMEAGDRLPNVIWPRSVTSCTGVKPPDVSRKKENQHKHNIYIYTHIIFSDVQYYHHNMIVKIVINDM